MLANSLPSVPVPSQDKPNDAIINVANTHSYDQLLGSLCNLKKWHGIDPLDYDPAKDERQRKKRTAGK